MQTLIHTLSNGLRVALQQSESNVAYIGLLTNAGSRDDFRELDGLAHFVEHTVFKGTPRRKSWIVNNRMELIGGELNAYTTKEEIMLYTNAPAGHEGRALELLADLVANAHFPEREIELERGVILEEIQSYADNAAYAVFDEFDEYFYKDSTLAHNILGYSDSVARIAPENARAFLTRFFAPGNMVAYCVTPTAPEHCLRLFEKYFGALDRPAPAHGRPAPAPNRTFDVTLDRNNHQANVVIGCPIFGVNDPRRYALYLFSNILGGAAMNSRLNRELRDRRGLVYTVETSISFYSDAGTFQVYFAADPSKADKCTRLIRREIERLASGPLPDRTFRRAQRQLAGQLLVSGENRENNAMSLAKSLMRHGEILDGRHTADCIARLAPADLLDMARFIAARPASRLIIT